jgi:outer membrane protein
MGLPMRVHQKVVFMLILILSSVQVSAQGLTLKDAWQIALQKNLTLQQVEKSIQQAKEEIKIQQNGFLPSIGGSASYHYQSEIPSLELPFQIPGQGPTSIEAGFKNQYDLNVGVQQPIFTGFRTYHLAKAAKEQFQSRLAGKQSTQNRLLLQIGQLFYTIQSNLLQQDIISQSIRRADDQLQRVNSLLTAEQAVPFDTLEIANRKLQQQIQLKNLDNIYHILLSQFNYLLNIDSVRAVHKVSIESTALPLISLDDYQKTALEQRPELAQLNFTKKAQSNQIKVFRSNLLPQVYASGSYHYAKPGVNFFKDEWMDYYAVGVNLQWSLWNWGRDYRKVRQARYEYDRLNLQNQELVNQINQQVKETYRYLENVQEQIKLQRKLVDQERKRYQMTEDMYLQGQATPLDLSDAEQRLTEADLLLKEKYMEWYQYHLKMDYVTGTISQ